MKSILTSTALASFLIAGGLFASLPAVAQNNEPCMGENCPTPDMPTGKKMKGVDQNNQDTDQPADQTYKRKKQMQGSSDQDDSQDQVLPRKKRAQNNNNNDVDVDVDVNVGSQKRARHADWRYDSSRHNRRRSKSATFRFYLDGYYYDRPYWEVYAVRGRVSCGEGRAIVSERFNRVRVVECNGGTYTYLGRRQGDTYRILLNARTGRIVGRALI